MAVLCKRKIQFIVVIVFEITVVWGKQCFLRETNQNLTKCEVSDWFAWNCICCGKDVLQQNGAMRDRGICCPEGVGQNITNCKTECNITVAVNERGLCADHCSYITRASFCSFATTPSQSTISSLEISTLKSHQELINDGTTWRLAERTRANDDKEDGATTTVNNGNINTFCFIGPWEVRAQINASSTCFKTVFKMFDQ